MNLKSGKIEGFEPYSQFSTVKEFNTHLEMWLLEGKNQFSKGELVGLKRLARFSAKIPGVCNAKIGTILKAIYEEYHEHGISRSTFKRMIQKAIKLGVITVYETERKNGSQSSNLYVFNRVPSCELPKEKIMNHHKETINLSETKKITKRREEPLKSDHTFVNDHVPQPFVKLVNYFFQEAKVIEEYWHMTKIAAYRNNHENETEQILETAIQSFKQLINKLKSTKKIKNPITYYYGILEKKFQELYFQELFEMGF
jgi:hypothetical protein